MIELIAATGGALLTAIFVSSGSLSYRGKKNRQEFDLIIPVTTSETILPVPINPKFIF